jgi:alpha 1,6-mannosyltransferase
VVTCQGAPSTILGSRIARPAIVSSHSYHYQLSKKRCLLLSAVLIVQQTTSFTHLNRVESSLAYAAGPLLPRNVDVASAIIHILSETAELGSKVKQELPRPFPNLPAIVPTHGVNNTLTAEHLKGNGSEVGGVTSIFLEHASLTMALSNSWKRPALAAIVLLVLFLLLRQSNLAPSLPPIGDANTNAGSQPSRSYPPPPTSPQALAQQKPVPEIAHKSLREKLRFHFPYEKTERFPAYIWQTWKYGPDSGKFEERLRGWEASWSSAHPGFVHEVITDEAALHLVNYLYASVPEVTAAYEAMPLPVIKADFFRYLILLARGGIYTDIDTQALKPAREWLPEGLDTSTVGLVVGIEADPDREDWAKWYSRRIQFCQWTMQAKPGHPVLQDIVATIIEDTLAMKSAGQLRAGHLPTSKSVVEYTGPAVWTDAIFRYLNNPAYFDFSGRAINVSYSDFFGITEQKKIGDVVVLPITSFSPGVGQMGAEGTEHPMAFVKHEFDGKSTLLEG